jgi:hypothetical protein
VQRWRNATPSLPQSGEGDNARRERNIALHLTGHRQTQTNADVAALRFSHTLQDQIGGQCAACRTSIAFVIVVKRSMTFVMSSW